MYYIAVVVRTDDTVPQLEVLGMGTLARARYHLRKWFADREWDDNEDVAAFPQAIEELEAERDLFLEEGCNWHMVIKEVDPTL